MTPTVPLSASTVVLSPSYRLPLFLAIAALGLLFVQIWLGLVLLLFAGFLLFQAATLRLHFTATALEIYRSEQLIRHFPYTEWLHWEIFWPRVPILFYFREANSIHFLPILFDPRALQAGLEAHCPRYRG